MTDQPYQLGDVVHERVRFAGLELDVTWCVTQHVRPSHVVLQALTSPARITYSFDAKGDTIEFRRELEYTETLLTRIVSATDDLRRLMQEQSDEGVRCLKALVEGILQDEQPAVATLGENR